jgi:hypothetical protein
MALSAACCAAGQESVFQAGPLGDLPELPAAVEELFPELALAFSVELPTPEAEFPPLLVRDELAPTESGLDRSPVPGDLPAPLPVPVGLLLCTSEFWPRAAVVVASVILPAPGRGSSSPPG